MVTLREHIKNIVLEQRVLGIGERKNYLILLIDDTLNNQIATVVYIY